jgi:ADP-ribose pyrophosphatase
LEEIRTVGNSHWQILDRRLLVDRSPFAKIYDEDVKLTNGETITNFVRVELPPFAIVFALMEDGRVPFVRQYRLGIRAYTLELPAGHLDGEEDALIGAKRELLEETGVEAPDWQFLGKYVMDANRHCGWCYAYLATRGGQVRQPDPGDLGEFAVEFLPFDEVQHALTSGVLISGPTALCAGLALNALSRQKVE